MLDHTMLAPGPAGTSMIGESNIKAAARRGLEKRRRREEELQRASQTGNASEEDAYPEATALGSKNAGVQDSRARYEIESESAQNAQRVYGTEELLARKGQEGPSSKSSDLNSTGKIRSAWAQA